MPYIKQQNRIPYHPIIKDMLAQLARRDDSLEQADYISYFIFGILDGFSKEYFNKTSVNAFDCVCDNAHIKQNINNLIQQSLSALSSKDIMERGGELNYLLSAIIWGFLGDYFESARYVVRAYMRGNLLKLQYMWGDLLKLQEQWDAIARGDNYRLHTLIMGVLEDVMGELYRRRTASYEDKQIVISGDLWPL